MDISKVIAENLRRLRNERYLSLGQLAELCELSKVLLSQIEKGATNPTINTLWKIANGLKVPYTALLEQQPRLTRILKKEDTDCQTVEDGHYRSYCYYPNTPNRNFELFQIELDANCQYTSVGHLEKSQEYILVLEGELSIQINGEVFVLAVDDAITFLAAETHTYSNTGKAMVKAAIINYYPV